MTVLASAHHDFGVVLTHDLSKGVLLGVVLSAIFFMRKAGKTIQVTEIETPEEGALR